MKKYLKLLALPIIVLVIAIIILITNIPRLEYKYNSEYEGYMVTKAIGNAEYYEIKDTYKNKAVVGIDEQAFKGHSNLKSITLPDTIEFVGRMAFYDCYNLESINLDNVLEIERNAFSYCEKLESLNVNALFIGASAFYKCKGLNEVNLSNTESIGEMAFTRTNLKKISIPASCIFVGDNAFSECYLLESINVYGTKLKENKYLNSLAIVNYINKE